MDSPDDILTTFTDITGNYDSFYYIFPHPEHTLSTRECVFSYLLKSVMETENVYHVVIT